MFRFGKKPKSGSSARGADRGPFVIVQTDVGTAPTVSQAWPRHTAMTIFSGTVRAGEGIFSPTRPLRLKVVASSDWWQTRPARHRTHPAVVDGPAGGSRETTR